MARSSRKRAPVEAPLPFQYGCEDTTFQLAPEIEQVPVPAPAYNRPPPALPSTPFGRWLLEQTKRDGWIGDLAKAAKADRGFPKAGDPDAVRKRLGELQAEGDMFEAVDDAEMAWLSY